MIRSLTIAAALAALAAGCGHHDHRRAASELGKEQDAAADAIVATARRYLDARTKPGPAPATLVEKQDLALEMLMDSAAALRVARAAERLADDADVDPGRAARLKTAAALVRKAATVTAHEAEGTLRSGEDAALKHDAAVLRALLRALKVDLDAVERELGE